MNSLTLLPSFYADLFGSPGLKIGHPADGARARTRLKRRGRNTGYLPFIRKGLAILLDRTVYRIDPTGWRRV